MTYCLNKNLILILLLFVSVYLPINAQIGIYNELPHASSVLDIQSPNNNQGLLIPRVTTMQKESIVKPASGLLVYDTNKQCLSLNVGTESVPNWLSLGQNTMRFFYMPSINIATPNIGSVPDIDLYEAYKKEFMTPLMKNSAAPQSIPYYTKATDLYYYVTYYDKAVMNITNITDDGKMSYSILRKADYDTYMNVVFVIK